MRLLALILLALSMHASAQQPSCDRVPEDKLPNCRFTQRSNYGLHGPVRTLRVTTKELAPDPRARVKAPDARLILSVSQPGVWIDFDQDGDGLVNVSAFDDSGKPIGISHAIRKVTGSTATTISGTADDPEMYRKVEKLDVRGLPIEQTMYEGDKPISRTVTDRDDQGNDVAIRTYDADGKLSSRIMTDRDDQGHEVRTRGYGADGKLYLNSVQRYDANGRNIEHIVYDHDRLVVHQVDKYDDTNDQKCACSGSLISREWYDDKGLLLRQVSLRDGRVTGRWQKPDCGQQCGENDTVGFNFAFDHSVSYRFQNDGTLLTTIEKHKGRYGNIDDDEVELRNEAGVLLEKIAYRYVRDEHGNWTERIASILDPETGQMVDVRLDKRQLSYY